jgi:two-component system OmpR family response regulator
LNPRGAADTKLTEFSPAGFTAVCCDDVMTSDDGTLLVVEDEELVARVRTVLRRSRPAVPEPVLSFADLTLNQDSYEVHRGGRLIELSPTEFRLLRYFMLNPGRVLTRAQLLSHVWDYDFGGSSNVVSTYVTYLRRKLASDGPNLIHTQRAVGFSLRLPRPGDEPGASEASPDESQASSDEP